MNRQFRQWVGDPPGTPIAWDEMIGDKGDRKVGPFPAKVFGIGVDAWDPAWPQSAGFWGEGGDWPSLLVVLGAYVTTAWDVGAAWRFVWSWHHPDWPGTCDIWPRMPGDSPGAKGHSWAPVEPSTSFRPIVVGPPTMRTLFAQTSGSAYPRLFAQHGTPWSSMGTPQS